MVVDEQHPVDLVIRVELGHTVRDRLRMGVARLVRETRELAGELEAAESQRAHASTPDADPTDLLALAA